MRSRGPVAGTALAAAPLLVAFAAAPGAAASGPEEAGAEVGEEGGEEVGERAGEWARFRGPNGAGVGPEGALPTAFGPTEALVFRAPLPPGHSSPILAGGRVHLTGFSESEFVTLALDAGTGAELWRARAGRERNTEVDSRNNAASPSVAADEEAVFAFFPDLGLLAYDARGRERWRTPLGPFDNLYGMGASPILAGGFVVLVLDQKLDSEILAFDRETGEIRWRTGRPEASSGHSTPILRRTDAGLEVIAPGSFRLTAYDLADGSARWWVDGLPWEMKSTPLLVDGRLFVNGYGAPLNQPGNQRSAPSFAEALRDMDEDSDGSISEGEAEGHPASWFSVIDLGSDGGLGESDWSYYESVLASQNGVLAIRPGAPGERGDLTGPNTLWSYRRRVPQLPSPLLYRGVLYLVNDGGIVTALDPETGQLLSQNRLAGAVDAYYASPVAADGKLFFVSELGMAVVARPLDPGEKAAELEVLRVNPLEEAVYATPAIAPSRLYIRTVEHLYAFGGKAAGG